jgi:putative tricarboxylic transport membrane protein
MRRDWIAGVVLLALAAGYYRMAVSIPRSQLSDVVGASSFPVLLSAALATLSVILILVGVFRKAPTVSAEESAKKAAGEVHGFVRAGGTLAIGVAFLMVLPYAGYIVAVAALLAAMVLYLHEPWSARVAIIAAAGGIFFWLMFRGLFAIPVPRGLWPALLHL